MSNIPRSFVPMGYSFDYYITLRMEIAARINI